MKILMIIPAYNEEDNILQTVKEIEDYNLNAEQQLDYIVINDGSTDHTEKILQKHKIHHISLIQNLGIGGAVQTGYMYAWINDYDIAVQFDGDGQHDIQSCKDIINPIRNHELDLCIGSRFGTENPNFTSSPMRRFGIKYLNALIYLVSGVKITDATSGYRASGKKVIEFFKDYYPVDYPEPESIVAGAKNNFKIGERPVNMFERVGGVSSIGFFDSVYYMIKVSLAIILEKIIRR